ncbi:serine hydrolase domain-containing protein [Arthrobacter sp. NtRootA1]|uniref:serine hydrolase domain-containing protein n=1 Tax=Arthrobacter sp. NtRootA1 TaxID=2830983 RepID=UPI001CC7EF07|nr:serine hydrolase domain-containing protein [Arthrobacter sp. NtRootA1]BCW05690.1 esterase [Arthrobacter sp. NtRootA1]
MTTIHADGYVAAGFRGVADTFHANFDKRGDTGAACTIYVHGELVLDLWAGSSERGPFTRDTRSVLFSVSKGITTICLLMAVEEGHLTLDAPVAQYWPEFAVHGKDTVTVRQLLAHQAGLIAPEERLTIEDLRAWTPVTETLAAQKPLWTPGTSFAYHALTIGWLAGELLRRTTGKRPSEWLRDRIADPLGLSMTFGADPDATDFAPLSDPLPNQASAVAAPADLDLVKRIMGMNGAIDGMNLFTTANHPDFLSYEMPAGNLVGTAHDLARLYSATINDVDGVQLLGPDTVSDARLPLSEGAPFVGVDAGHRWGTGFMIDSSARAMAGPGSFGHDGAGGQLGFANPELGVAFGYQTIRPGGEPDYRAEDLCRALRDCL